MVAVARGKNKTKWDHDQTRVIQSVLTLEVTHASNPIAASNTLINFH